MLAPADPGVPTCAHIEGKTCVHTRASLAHSVPRGKSDKYCQSLHPPPTWESSVFWSPRSQPSVRPPVSSTCHKHQCADTGRPPASLGRNNSPTSASTDTCSRRGRPFLSHLETAAHRWRGGSSLRSINARRAVCG